MILFRKRQTESFLQPSTSRRTNPLATGLRNAENAHEPALTERRLMSNGLYCSNMKGTDWDVIIVGAGPTGGRTATHLSSLGHRVLMLEEHSEIGRPFQCAGLVTPKALQEVGLYDSVLEEVDGARIHGPSGTLVPVGTDGKLRTYVVCRKKFDQGVVQQAMESGATLWLNSQPLSAENSEENVSMVVVQNGVEKKLTTKLLIGCDGAHSWTRRYFKMGRPKEMMIGFQAEVLGYEGNKRWLDMYLSLIHISEPTRPY